MKMSNVFLVSGRQCDASGEPRGGLVNHVLCALSEVSMRALAAQELPGFFITSVVSLAVLDRTAKKVKNVLSGADDSWNVFVEVGLE